MAELDAIPAPDCGAGCVMQLNHTSRRVNGNGSRRLNSPSGNCGTK